MRSPLYVLLFIMLSICTTALADTAQGDSFPGIKALMKKEEFKSSGLDKLTDQEIDQLNQWLIRYTAVEAPIVKTNAEVEKVAEEEAQKEIHSAIDGAFYGWSGKTTFSLRNGQVWEQRYSGKWQVNLDSPKVVIRRNFMGFYQMEVVDSKRVIGVRRIR